MKLATMKNLPARKPANASPAGKNGLDTGRFDGFRNAAHSAAVVRGAATLQQKANGSATVGNLGVLAAKQSAYGCPACRGVTQRHSTQKPAQLKCNKGHVGCPDGPCALTTPKASSISRLAGQGVKLGEHHKYSGTRPGKSKTGTNMQDRMERHLPNALKNMAEPDLMKHQPTLAKITGQKNGNLEWEMEQADPVKQVLEGSKRSGQIHMGGGSGGAVDAYEHGTGPLPDSEKEDPDFPIGSGADSVIRGLAELLDSGLKA